MADFNNFTSGFVVSGQNIGIQAAKITTATEGVATAFNTSEAQKNFVPTIDAINTWATTALVASAEHADWATSANNSERLGGHEAGYFATSGDLNLTNINLSTVSGDVDTLESYFDENGVAKSAASAAKADLADAATSAAKADALKTPFGLTATNDYGSVSFAGIDGSGDKTGTFTLDVATTIAPTESSTATGLAPASAVESALFEVEQKIGEITSFEVVTDHTQVTDPKTNIIYLEGPKSSVTGDDKYEEWIYTNSTWTKIGETSIDLSNYYTKTETDSAISTAVAAEETRAKGVEDALSEQLTAEISRADAAEKANAAAITAEETRAKGVEEALDAAIDSTSASLNTHIATTAVHIQTGERDLWNTVSAMATSAEFTALEGRVTIAEGEIDTLQSAMTQAQTDIGALQTAISGTDGLDSRVDTLETTVGDSNGGLVKNVADLQTSATALDGKIEAVDEKVVALKYYDTIKVMNGDSTVTTSATKAKDGFAFKAGTGVELAATTDADGNPTITIAANGAAFTMTGDNGVNVSYNSTNNKYTISGVDATTAAAGVVKATYIDSDNLIHLF